MHTYKALISTAFAAVLALQAVPTTATFSPCDNKECLTECSLQAYSEDQCIQQCCVQADNVNLNSDLPSDPFISLLDINLAPVQEQEQLQGQHETTEQKVMSADDVLALIKDPFISMTGLIHQTEDSVLQDSQESTFKAPLEESDLQSLQKKLLAPWLPIEIKGQPLEGEEMAEEFDHTLLFNAPWLSFMKKSLQSTDEKLTEEVPSNAESLQNKELPWFSLFGDALKTIDNHNNVEILKLVEGSTLFTNIEKSLTAAEKEMARHNPKSLLSFINKDQLISLIDQSLKDSKEPEQAEAQALESLKLLQVPWISLFTTGAHQIANIHKTDDVLQLQEGPAIQVLVDETSEVLQQINQDQSYIAQVSGLNKLMTQESDSQVVMKMIDEQSQLNSQLEQDTEHKKMIYLRSMAMKAFNDEILADFSAQSGAITFEEYQIGRVTDRTIYESHRNIAEGNQCDFTCGTQCLQNNQLYSQKEQCLESQCECTLNFYYNTQLYCSDQCAANCKVLETSTKVTKCVSQCGCEPKEEEKEEEKPKEEEGEEEESAAQVEAVQALYVVETPSSEGVYPSAVPKVAIIEIVLLAVFVIIFIGMALYSYRRVKRLAQKSQLFKPREIKQARKEKMINAEEILDTFEIEAQYERVM